jgi:hypothetical protein
VLFAVVLQGRDTGQIVGGNENPVAGRELVSAHRDIPGLCVTTGQVETAMSITRATGAGVHQLRILLAAHLALYRDVVVIEISDGIG